MNGSHSTGSRWAAGFFVIVLVLGACYGLWLAAGAPDLLAGLRSLPSPPAGTTAPEGPLPTRTLRPTGMPRPTKTPRASPEPGPTAGTTDQAPRLKVGVVAGHWQNDSGAVCPDGLEEVSINLDVAARLVAILQYEGYDAELLAEFDPRLPGYRADAFVSVHTDSCDVPGASGFKVARLAASAIPEEEDRLVRCITREYAAATGLAFHRDSITFDMTEYHAFREIDPQTPGVIVELGFMAADRVLLTGHSYEVAQGLARGVACFLEQ